MEIIFKLKLEINFLKISEKYNLSSEEIGLLVGKSRSHVSNILRLTNLSDTVYQALKEEKVTMGQVRPLINLELNLQNSILNEIISEIIFNFISKSEFFSFMK